MKKDLLSILIIGGDSLIGSNLIKYLKKKKINFLASSRKDKLSESFFYLDHARPIRLPQYYFSHAVICSGITKESDCKSDLKKSNLINVDSIKLLIKKLNKRKIKTIFLSSHSVFDGSKSFYTTEDNCNPITTYGKQKYKSEKFCQNYDVAILRLTKVIDQNTPLIKKWKFELHNSNPIKAFIDDTISAVLNNEVAKNILTLIVNFEKGIYHLGGKREISFFEFACKTFPDSLSLIEPSIKFNGNKSKHSSLMTSKVFNKKNDLSSSSYSFEGQDLILLSLFRNVKIGTYIEVGANHPLKSSNTMLLYEKGWSGLCIDGNSKFCNDWEKLRKRDKFLECSVSDKKKHTDFYFFPDDTMNSIDPFTIKKYKKRFNKNSIKKKIVITDTIYNLYNSFLKGKEVHLLSIDIEGEDFNALQGASLEKLNPGIIIIEIKDLNLNKAINNEIIMFLNKLNYSLIAKTPLDSIFVHSEKSYLNWIPKTLF